MNEIHKKVDYLALALLALGGLEAVNGIKENNFHSQKAGSVVAALAITLFTANHAIKSIFDQVRDAAKLTSTALIQEL